MTCFYHPNIFSNVCDENVTEIKSTQVGHFSLPFKMLLSCNKVAEMKHLIKDNIMKGITKTTYSIRANLAQTF